jgi:hypothetical protein
MTKGHVTRCNFFCNLQCNSTLERCKIAKYESSLHMFSQHIENSSLISLINISQE